MADLFHFCCAHSAKAIGRYGLIIPQAESALSLGVRVSWFTDDITLPREAYGLTMHTIACDRMEYLYRVLEADVPLCEPFLEWQKRLGNPFVGKLVNDENRPDRWFVCEKAVRVRKVVDYHRT